MGQVGKRAVRIFDFPRFEKIFTDTLRVRAGGSELHNISAMIGGIVAQEVIKVESSRFPFVVCEADRTPPQVITKQYIPANNTVVLDGIVSKTGTYEF